jgi:hypothetical protein
MGCRGPKIRLGALTATTLAGWVSQHQEDLAEYRTGISPRYPLLNRVPIPLPGYEGYHQAGVM